MRNISTSKGSTLASDPSPVSGLWRLAGQARAVAARLAVGSDGSVRIVDETGRQIISASLAAVTVSDRIASIPRHVTFAGAGDFETGDNDGVDRLIAPHVGASAGLIHGLEKFRPRMIVFVALVIGLGVAIYRYAVPALVEVAIWATPPVVTELMSQGVMTSLDGSIFEKTGLPPERQKELTDAFQAIAKLTPRTALAEKTGKPAYTLNFRKGGAIGPNAFALPDGTLVITDELLELSTDDDMVLGVLAHEIGHVDREHSLRQLYRAAGVSMLIMLIGGDIGGGTEDILVQGSALLQLSYSRSAEAEADRYSVELMHEAGKDPAAIARFFELLRDKLGDKSESDFFSTHPATPERIAETHRYAAEIAGKE